MATRPHAESDSPLHEPLQSFDLDGEVTRLREERAWQEGGDTRSRFARARA